MAGIFLAISPPSSGFGNESQRLLTRVKIRKRQARLACQVRREGIIARSDALSPSASRCLRRHSRLPGRDNDSRGIRRFKLIGLDERRYVLGGVRLGS